MIRRTAAIAAFVIGTLHAAPGPTVSTLVGNGSPGFADAQVNNPYGLVIGPTARCISAISTTSGSAVSTCAPSR